MFETGNNSKAGHLLGTAMPVAPRTAAGQGVSESVSR